MTDIISLLIADDEPSFRSGLRALLDSADDMALVGEAINGEETVRLALSLQPDVILMDIHMPDPAGTGLNGIEATQRILRTSPHIGILMLTMFEDDESVFSAMRAGARGYLLKGALKAEMLRAVRAVASGEAIFSPAIAQRLTLYFTNIRATTAADIFPELTEREREVLDLTAQHFTNTEIAERLTLSPKTVRNHISNIFDKLQVADRAEAILRAREAGLG